MSDHAHTHDHPRGWKRWLYSTNHKDIGSMYIILSIIGALIGGGMSWLIRLELAQPGLQWILDTQFYNVLVTAHGFLMVFFVVMPAMIGGFGNWFVQVRYLTRPASKPAEGTALLCISCPDGNLVLDA